ncbi:metal ABC transporter substrate-binding protein [Demequina soli]|uniref:metal ABC transporter substrate-binding protein n=1 Tax=Demequina soli TaxID=1638987 RepID=UPI001E599288|nr:metal ABC transporter substrate-binding protein [Demequina soli]
MQMNTRRTGTLVAVAAVSTLALAGCSADPIVGGASSTDPNAALTVATAFYPLEYVAQQVGGDLVSIVSMTPAGIEPHDVELSPATVRKLGTADLALYLSDFQPAVDDAVSTTGVQALDAASVVTLHAPDEHTDDEAQTGHDHGTLDPHFWLDPELLAKYGDAVGEAFAKADPAHAETYTANAQALHASLDALNEDYTTGLASCQRDTFVTSHEAFGYLADAYNLTQVPIAGLDPESEPSPARILEIKKVIEDTGATTVFTESAVSATVAQSLADDLGVTTEVLSPVETVANGDDYIGVMTRNLTTLEGALGCE